MECFECYHSISKSMLLPIRLMFKYLSHSYSLRSLSAMYLFPTLTPSWLKSYQDGGTRTQWGEISKCHANQHHCRKTHQLPVPNLAILAIITVTVDSLIYVQAFIPIPDMDYQYH